MEKNIKSKKNALELLRDYLDLYGKMYPINAVEFIEERFSEMILDKDKTDIITQIYAELGILPDNENYYLRFAKMIGERYGWDLNILEIGCGFFPSLSKYIDLKQQELGTGTITAYDPFLVTESLGNIRLHRESFIESMDVSSYDLIVGVMPCDSTEIIIKRSVISKKEFFVALCGCTHFLEGGGSIQTPYSFTYKMEEYHDRVFDMAMEQEKDGFRVKMERVKEFYYKYPIISSKRI